MEFNSPSTANLVCLNIYNTVQLKIETSIYCVGGAQTRKSAAAAAARRCPKIGGGGATKKSAAAARRDRRRALLYSIRCVSDMRQTTYDVDLIAGIHTLSARLLQRCNSRNSWHYDKTAAINSEYRGYFSIRSKTPGRTIPLYAASSGFRCGRESFPRPLMLRELGYCIPAENVPRSSLIAGINWHQLNCHWRVMGARRIFSRGGQIRDLGVKVPSGVHERTLGDLGQSPRRRSTTGCENNA